MVVLGPWLEELVRLGRADTVRWAAANGYLGSPEDASELEPELEPVAAAAAAAAAAAEVAAAATAATASAVLTGGVV